MIEKKGEYIIHPRVKVVIHVGQEPQPWRTHWLVLVDGKAVWHQTSHPNPRYRPQHDLLDLAKFIAHNEAQNVSRWEGGTSDGPSSDNH